MILISTRLRETEYKKRQIKDKFKYLTRSFTNFDSLTEERRKELIEDAKKLYEEFINGERIVERYYNILSYLCTVYYLNHKNNNIYNNYYKSEEMICVLIETVDPDLTMFKISHKCGNDFQTEKMICSKFGFYDPALIDYEREYAKRYYKRKPQIHKKILES